MKLYQISNTIRDILDLAAETGGEIGPAQLSALDQLSDSRSVKMDGICGLIREWEAFVSVRKAEIDRLKAGIATHENNIRRLKDYLLQDLQKLGEQRSETALFKVWRQASPPSAVCEAPADLLPDYLRKVTVAPNLSAAIDEWKRTGQAPAGFTVSQAEHVRIK